MRSAPARRRWLFHFTLAAVAVLFAINNAASAAESRPNILLIVADDLGYGELGCQGSTDIPTPHVDAIAAGGVRFTSGYVSCPVCSPTRAGLMTGRYQQRFGHEFNPGPVNVAGAEFGLAPDEATIAERLKAAGYATGLVGKWHLGYREGTRPTERGFDEFFGFYGGSHPYDLRPRHQIVRGIEPVDESAYLTDAFEREAIAFIDKHKAEPFFLYLAFNAVHSPLQATPEDLEKFSNITDPKRRTFAGMLSAMDDAIGAVRAKLRDEKLESNTLVVFVSDNGGPTQQTNSQNGPLRGVKGTTWEGGIRVPFMISWPGHLPAGKTDDRPVIALDVLPTALAAAGVTTASEKPLDGVNLIPYLDGTTAESPHKALYWRFGDQMAIRSGDWKLVRANDRRAARRDAVDPDSPAQQLFNLAEDVGEANDLSAKHPDKLAELTTLYEQWNAELIPPKWQRTPRAAARRQQ